MKRKITIGSRGSQLALWQANYTKQQLEQLGYDVHIHIIVTEGDKRSLQNIAKGEGKGLFTKEIELALLNGEIDLAVHSYKDLPTENPEGLKVVANSSRENPADWLIIKKKAVDNTQPYFLKPNALVGTSSARRKAQFRALRSDVMFKDIRGNVPTRLRKMDEGDWDAIILAAAGITRLSNPVVADANTEIDLSNYRVVEFKPQEMVPAPVQGILAYQIREEDTETRQAIQHLHDEEVGKAAAIERSIMTALGGGCQQPIGVFCQWSEQKEAFEVWASQAKSCKHFPKKVFVCGTSPTELVQKVTTQLAVKEKKKVFISRGLMAKSYFQKALQAKGHQVYGQSLIEFEGVHYPQQSISNTDWVFFSSQNGVRYFFEQNPEVSKTTQLAVIGNGTLKAVQQYGHVPAFVGNGKNISQIAEAFEQLAKGQTVLFPQAQNSLQSIQKHLNGHIQSQNLVVYNNIPRQNINLPHNQFDVLVFTSPLNVQVYCQHYAIHSKQKIVVIGTTTAAALHSLGYTNYVIAYAPDEMSLADVC